MNTRYHPYYCEENIWFLCGEISDEAWVVFATNPERCCSARYMRASPEPDLPVFWDYHVFLISRPASGPCLAWDPDCTLGMPLPLDEYLKQVFYQAADQDLSPFFRVVSAQAFQAHFSSDRRHMCRKGEDKPESPPPWPAIYHDENHTLGRFIDLDDHLWVGQWLDAAGVLSRFASGAGQHETEDLP